MEGIHCFDHLISLTNTIVRQRELFGGHLEPLKTLARNVKNHHNFLQKALPARENRTDLECWRAHENQLLACFHRDRTGAHCHLLVTLCLRLHLPFVALVFGLRGGKDLRDIPDFLR